MLVSVFSHICNCLKCDEKQDFVSIEKDNLSTLFYTRFGSNIQVK